MRLDIGAFRWPGDAMRVPFLAFRQPEAAVRPPSGTGWRALREPQALPENPEARREKTSKLDWEKPPSSTGKNLQARLGKTSKLDWEKPPGSTGKNLQARNPGREAPAKRPGSLGGSDRRANGRPDLLTRTGEAGAPCFTLAKIAGHQGSPERKKKIPEAGAPCFQSPRSQGIKDGRTAPENTLQALARSPPRPYLVNLTVNGAVVCSIGSPARFRAVW
jgi:hypothetical protein